jgi:hypothetical protein
VYICQTRSMGAAMVVSTVICMSRVPLGICRKGRRQALDDVARRRIMSGIWLLPVGE